MSDCGCRNAEANTLAQRRVLRIALILNTIMFVAETSVGVLTHSSGLIADGLDMLADAAAYAIALVAVMRDDRFKASAARMSGVFLLLLGVGVIVDAGRRFIGGELPEGLWMIGASTVALAINVIVLRLLADQRHDAVHMRAAWIFTRADVLANAAVIFSGLAVLVTHIRQFDAVVGAAIGAYVVREALEILRDAKEVQKA